MQHRALGRGAVPVSRPPSCPVPAPAAHAQANIGIRQQLKHVNMDICTHSASTIGTSAAAETSIPSSSNSGSGSSAKSAIAALHSSARRKSTAPAFLNSRHSLLSGSQQQALTTAMIAKATNQTAEEVCCYLHNRACIKNPFHSVLIETCCNHVTFQIKKTAEEMRKLQSA